MTVSRGATIREVKELLVTREAIDLPDIRILDVASGVSLEDDANVYESQNY